MCLLLRSVDNNLKISIITVAFNSQSTIKHTIESVKSQDYSNVEYIIIDGGSTDWTLEVLEYCKENIDHFISENDSGIYDAMNKGIKAATGDIIGILNSDDFYPNNSVISKVADVFNTTECDCLYGDLVYVKNSDARKIVRYWKSGKFNVNKIKKGWMLPHPTFFVRKKIYNKYGMYNTQLKSAADYEMILRLLYKHKLKVEYIPEIMVKMRMGGKSNESIFNRLRANYEDNMAWSLNDLYKPYFIRILKPMLKLKQFFKKPKI
jgi:glycosyltransferase involved in cell wall biosynthesis